MSYSQRNASLRALAAGALLLAASNLKGETAKLASESQAARLLVGVGGAVPLSPTPGFAPSVSLALETSRLLVLAEAFWGRDLSNFDVFFGGAAGTLIGNGEHVPYALVGLGYLSRYVFDTRGHDTLALTLEAGAVLSRSRRAGQIWIGARGFIPVSEVSSYGRPEPPPVPFLSINLRFWF